MAKILVPVDGSDAALRALAFAIKRAKDKAGTSIHVLTVHLPLDTHGKIAVYPGEKRMRELAALHDAHILRSAEKRLRRARIDYSTEAIEGDPAEVIVRRAKTLKCDSIVMGSRGLGRIASLIIGSVAFKVIHVTSLPVTLVK